VRERLLGDAHAGVADHAGGALDHRGVWDEALDPDVRRRREVSRVDVGGRDHHFEQLPGERLAGGLDDAAVVLEQRRAGDQHQRRFDVVEPGGTVEGGSQSPGPTSRTLAGQSERGYSNGSTVKASTTVAAR
jgi:hypothetical protein